MRIKGNLDVTLNVTDALIVVDIQNDFISGSLPVEGAEGIIPAVNRYIELFERSGSYIFFTRDWHPENHISFKENGGVWPKHCVAGSWGAEFHPDLRIPKDNFFIISKGANPNFDAYSGFQDTVLDSILRERGINRVFICGLALDYCVKHTAFGALNLGYSVFLLLDAVKAVNLNPQDGENALKFLYEKGAVGVVFE